MTWPNNDSWSAEANDIAIDSETDPRFLWTIDCGEVFIPSGKLVACDPFAMMAPGNNPYTRIQPGRYPVSVTLADVSKSRDKSHIREAYVTLRISPGRGSYRRVLPLLRDGDEVPVLAEGEFIGFGVDAGTACFVDDEATLTCMTDPNEWLEDLFENESPDSWFNIMDDPNHIREGIANIKLPLARNGENILIVHSGWGDGCYPVVGLYDETDNLIAVHIDFGVVE